MSAGIGETGGAYSPRSVDGSIEQRHTEFGQFRAGGNDVVYGSGELRANATFVTATVAGSMSS
jgi:hypothetical protein